MEAHIKKAILYGLTEQLKKNGFIEISLTGYSMYPTIRNGDKIKIYKYNYDNVKPGDIIAFLHKNADHLIVHRVIKLEEVKTRKILVTKGDNNEYVDPKVIREENFIGIVNIF